MYLPQELGVIMSDRFWKIRGNDGGLQVFERAIAEGSLSESEMIVILQRLASRHLTDYEVASWSLRDNANGYAAHLEVQRCHGKNYALMTTRSDHHYIANEEINPKRRSKKIQTATIL
jgi:hypothetical protein